MFAHLSVWGILLAAVSAMIVGTLWYSPMLFGKRWGEITGVTPKIMAEKQSQALPSLVIISLVTAYTLGLFIVYFQAFSGNSGLYSGFAASLIAEIGLGATSVFAHGVFEPRDKTVLYINAGNRIVTFVIMGLIIGAFLPS